MLYIMIGVIVFLFILVCILLFLYYKNKYDFLFMKVKEADNNLDIILEKKIELLVKISNILEKEKIKDLPDIFELKSKKLNHFECYSLLNKSGNEMMKIVEDHESKMKEKNINRILEKLENNECDLKATLKYYNDSAIEINHYIHKFPSNFVKIFCHYQELPLYKIEKREIFEILKTN